MDRVNLPASIQNLANVDKLQQREHHNPVLYSVQNSEIDESKHDEQMRQPQEVNETENRIVDPDDRKKEEQRKKKREGKRKPDTKNRGSSSGKFIDFSA